MIRGLDAAGAAKVVYRLGDRYASSGQDDLAAETYEFLADAYPNDPLTRPALVWLVQHYASGEHAERAGDAAGKGKRLDRAVALAALLERTRPELFASGSAISRRRGLSQAGRTAAGPTALRDAERRPRRPVVDLHRGELWLLEPKGPPPKPILSCAAATERPRLDGRLDDAVWQQAKPVALHSGLHDDSQWPAEAMLAHDSEFLYLGIRCREAPGRGKGRRRPASPRFRSFRAPIAWISSSTSIATSPRIIV